MRRLRARAQRRYGWCGFARRTNTARFFLPPLRCLRKPPSVASSDDVTEAEVEESEEAEEEEEEDEGARVRFPCVEEAFGAAACAAAAAAGPGEGGSVGACSGAEAPSAEAAAGALADISIKKGSVSEKCHDPKSATVKVPRPKKVLCTFSVALLKSATVKNERGTYCSGGISTTRCPPDVAIERAPSP